MTYLLADQLGSTVGTLTDTGAAQHVQYYPFGNVRSGSVATDKMFTGQQREGFSRIGAYFYHARFYSTALGHFMSADSMTADGLDRYAYVRFNPLRYSDPTGLDAASDLKALAEAYNSLATDAQKAAFKDALSRRVPEIDATQIRHASARGRGSIEPTEENLAHLKEIASDPNNLKAIYSNGTRDYAVRQPDGSEIWVRIYGPEGKISNWGANETGSTYNPVRDGEGRVIDYERIPGEPVYAEPAEPPPGEFMGAPIDTIPGVVEGDAGCSTIDPWMPCE